MYDGTVGVGGGPSNRMDKRESKGSNRVVLRLCFGSLLESEGEGAHVGFVLLWKEKTRMGAWDGDHKSQFTTEEALTSFKSSSGWATLATDEDLDPSKVGVQRW